MVKRIKDIGIKTRRIIVTDVPARRIDPELVAKLLGAEPSCKRKFFYKIGKKDRK